MVDHARVAAFEVLRAVRADDAYANLVLPVMLRDHRLTGRDAALATELASGTLRRQGTYDAIIDSLVSRQVDPAVRDVLRLGTHQMLSMRVPTHAAVSTSVDLARSSIGHQVAGFVNAVLRKVSARGLDAWVRRVAPDPTSDLVGYLSIAYSHPRWIVAALAAALERPDELEALLSADNASPAVHLAAIGVSQAELAADVGGEPSLSPVGVVLPGGNPADLAAVRSGRARVQDSGSQLVALAALTVPIVGPDTRWLDLCAGPGGKAALLAAAAARVGARVTANEVTAHRAELVRAAVAGYPVDVVLGDGRHGAWAADSFDRVLVDAPCSGLGALRRRPEARWRRQPGDLDSLVPLQRELLSAALAGVRPGGVVLYATCSPVIAETAEVVSGVLADHRDVELVPLAGPADSASAHLAGAVQLWPHRHRTDAMFYAALRRSSSPA